MTTQGIGAQDNDRIEMHVACCGSEVGSPHSLEDGAFTAEAGWVWAECLREANIMRREAYGEHYFDGAYMTERERGIPAW